MPLPPAPSHRASRLTHTAFESSEMPTDAPVMVQIETKRDLASETPEASSAKRTSKPRKNEARS
jgi:PhoH-like ATPase